MTIDTLAKANTIQTRIEELERFLKYFSDTNIPSYFEISREAANGPLGSKVGVTIHYENAKKILPLFNRAVRTRLDELEKELSEL